MIEPYRDPILQQLLKRIPLLAGCGDQAARKSLQTVLTLIYEARMRGNGVLTASDVDEALESDCSLTQLKHHHPEIFSDDAHSGVITCFGKFICFSKTYQQLCEIVTTLTKRQALIPLKKSSYDAITWTLDGGHTLNPGQQLAAISAASMPFCVITGGAGTGKTTTLSKALELILTDNPETNIFLSAPAGKAAQRLNESLHKQASSLQPHIAQCLQPLSATTIHRLLGISEETGKAFKNSRNPLTCDVLVIDEASMIGGELMAKIFAALPQHSRLILMGDPNQLPPVNATNFFGDISHKQPEYSETFAHYVNNLSGMSLATQNVMVARPLTNQICHLSESKRFIEDSIVATCANAALSNDATTMISALGKMLFSTDSVESIYQQLADNYPNNSSGVIDTCRQRIILCANRQGQLGTKAINHYIDNSLRTAIGSHKEIWYEGRQILIEKNHFELNLNNGDIGTCRKEGGNWIIDFGDNRTVAAELLPPEHSLAFAITIHKSQGSEYQHVDILLESFDREGTSSHITRELLYTAITRAKHSLSIYSDHELLHKALSDCDKDNQQSPLEYLLTQ